MSIFDNLERDVTLFKENLERTNIVLSSLEEYRNLSDTTIKLLNENYEKFSKSVMLLCENQVETIEKLNKEQNENIENFCSKNYNKLLKLENDLNNIKDIQHNLYDQQLENIKKIEEKFNNLSTEIIKNQKIILYLSIASVFIAFIIFLLSF